jgi:hypothetical protein
LRALEVLARRKKLSAVIGNVSAMTKLLSVAVLILTVTVASADPIVVPGTVWHPMPTMNNDGTPFFDNTSWDCNGCNIGFLFQGFEWLEASPWTVTDVSMTSSFGISDYFEDHTFGRDPITGALWLNSGHGYIATSLSGQVVIMRQVLPDRINYFAAFEDLPDTGRTDRDFNDRVLQWTVQQGAPVPEPGTMLLVATGVVYGIVRRRHKTRR